MVMGAGSCVRFRVADNCDGSCMRPRVVRCGLRQERFGVSPGCGTRGRVWASVWRSVEVCALSPAGVDDGWIFNEATTDGEEDGKGEEI
jgi:hypothetical protein